MKVFRTISTIAFSLLVVFSSSSFMIGIHICCGNIQDVALFTNAQSCANKMKMPHCNKKESKPCCEDERVIHEGQEIRSDVSKLQLAPVPVADIDKPLVLIAEVIPSASFAKTKYYNYDPPLRSTDLTVSFQVFLI